MEMKFVAAVTTPDWIPSQVLSAAGCSDLPHPRWLTRLAIDHRRFGVISTFRLQSALAPIVWADSRTPEKASDGVGDFCRQNRRSKRPEQKAGTQWVTGILVISKVGAAETPDRQNSNDRKSSSVIGLCDLKICSAPYQAPDRLPPFERFRSARGLDKIVVAR